ncbi:hypothetical protein BGZ73_002372 [Actinomortierella ambigua]|nr:hypothetical protein BGZ73_002372 [Actinomortierella ambigua]
MPPFYGSTCLLAVQIAVEERPGSYPRARSNRAHYESRVAFMSALVHQEELDSDSSAGKGKGSGSGSGSSGSSGSGNPKNKPSDNTNNNNGLPMIELDLNLTTIPQEDSGSNSSPPTTTPTVVAAPMLAGDPRTDDPMLWDPAEHQARRALLVERYYQALERQQRSTEEAEEEEEEEEEAVEVEDNNHHHHSLAKAAHYPPRLSAIEERRTAAAAAASTAEAMQKKETREKKKKKRALVGIQPVRGDHLDRQWVAAMNVGNPPQIFSAVFDTGSSDVWVASSACTTEECRRLRQFSPSSSSTFQTVTGPFNINYADNTWIQGTLGKDDVSVAGIKIRQQTFGLATAITTRTEVDSIMGLGFDSNSEIPGMKTPVTNMIEQGQIDQPVVSVWLNKAVNQGKDISNGGQFIFGGVNTSLFYGSITYLPVTSSREWQVATDKIMLGNKMLSSNPPDAIIDTGASYIVFPESLATSFHRMIPNAQYDREYGWLVPCSMASSKTIGDLAFMFDDTRFSVPFSDIVILKSEYNGFCFSAVDSWREVDGHGGQNTIVLGDLFIKNQYVIFDYGKKQVGLAQKVENTPSGIGLNSRNAAGMDRRSLLEDVDSKTWRHLAIILTSVIFVLVEGFV